MDISKQAREALESVFGSEQLVLENIAQQAKDGNFQAMKLLLSYAYGTPVKNTEVILIDHTYETMIPASKVDSWGVLFRRTGKKEETDKPCEGQN